MIFELKQHVSQKVLVLFVEIILHLLSFVFQRAFKLHDYEFGFQLQLIVVELKCLQSLRIVLFPLTKFLAPFLDEILFFIQS
jgi:hypothetical protein